MVNDIDGEPMNDEEILQAEALNTGDQHGEFSTTCLGESGVVTQCPGDFTASDLVDEVTQHSCDTAATDTSEHLDDVQPTVLTVLADDPIRKRLQDAVHEHAEDITEIHLHTSEGLDRVLDDIAWNSTLDHLRDFLRKSMILATCVMAYGTTLNAEHRGEDIWGNKSLTQQAKKNVRTESCIYLRILQLLQLLATFAVPWFLIIHRWWSAQPVSILDLPDYDIIKQRAHQDIVFLQGSRV